MHIQPLVRAGVRLITETFERGPGKRGTAISLVKKTQLGIQKESILSDTFLQCCNLAGDCLLMGLLFRRDTRINRDSLHGRR